MGQQNFETTAVIDKNWLTKLSSRFFTKISTLWILIFVSKPHDEDHDRHNSDPSPPISDSSDIEAQQVGPSPAKQPNPVVQLFRGQDLGKTVLGFVMPMTTGLLSVYSKESSPILIQLTLVSLCIGLAALWNGILLRETFPRVANGIEQLGAVSILLAFFGVISLFLPPSLIWAPWFCFGLSILPFSLSYLPS